jgi:hypothetical protein
LYLGGKTPEQYREAVNTMPPVVAVDIVLDLRNSSAREITIYADVARLGHVSRARACQILNLLQLAPDLQE